MTFWCGSGAMLVRLLILKFLNSASYSYHRHWSLFSSPHNRCSDSNNVLVTILWGNIGGGVGFYDIFGPGTGSFFASKAHVTLI